MADTRGKWPHEVVQLTREYLKTAPASGELVAAEGVIRFIRYKQTELGDTYARMLLDADLGDLAEAVAFPRVWAQTTLLFHPQVGDRVGVIAGLYAREGRRWEIVLGEMTLID